MSEAVKRPLAVPTVNLNGTSGKALLEELITAMEAVSAATSALQRITVNGRDFHVQEPEDGKPVIWRALDEHRARVAKLMEVHEELSTIAVKVMEQTGGRG